MFKHLDDIRILSRGKPVFNRTQRRCLALCSVIMQANRSLAYRRTVLTNFADHQYALQYYGIFATRPT